MTDASPPPTAVPGRLTPRFRPQQLESQAPCQACCAVSGDVRGWIGIVAQRGKTGADRELAYAQAWETIVDRNPFPSVLGRVCPHPCEAGCNRATLDESVSINALERFLGDWAIAEKLPLPRLEADAKAESIGVIGTGPSGLSFAYQMARRGYRVTAYEQRDQPGGMLRYGIPDYRLPPDVLDAEIARILDLGVELRCGTVIGRDVSLDELRARHTIVYLGIGAQDGRELGIPGEADPSVWRGTDYLLRVNRGEPPRLGQAVAVIGGGNTAVDAARTARRAGAQVTVVYRRSREEMPAIESEVADALEEGIRFEFLVAPVRIDRRDGATLVLTLERMQLGEPDESGRARPVPVPDSTFGVAVDSVIAAVSQMPSWSGLEALQEGGWLSTDGQGLVASGIWAGGDVLGLGIVGDGVLHGRRAAETLHARLQGLPEPESRGADRPVEAGDILVDFYPTRPRARSARLTAAEALRNRDAEVAQGISEEQFLDEVARCFSCGSCFGCQQCAMFCTALSFGPVDAAAPGSYFSLSLDACRECGKCVEVCPCHYLQLSSGDPSGA